MSETSHLLCFVFLHSSAPVFRVLKTHSSHNIEPCNALCEQIGQQSASQFRTHLIRGARAKYLELLKQAGFSHSYWLISRALLNQPFDAEQSSFSARKVKLLNRLLKVLRGDVNARLSGDGKLLFAFPDRDKAYDELQSVCLVFFFSVEI